MSIISRSAVALLLFCPPLVGCQTASQVEAQRMASQAQKAQAETEACFSRVLDDPQYAAVLSNLHFDLESNPPLQMLSNKEYPSDQELVALTTMHQAVQPCRKISLEGAGATHPAWVPMAVEHYAWMDGLYLKLVNRGLTWGRANEMMMDHRQWFIRKSEEITANISRNLEASHRYEMQQRQAAAAALQQWSYQQQMLGALKQPTMTNCYYVGNMLNCTSY